MWVLMIGGNIPGETRVISIALYDLVESQQYVQAHWLAGGLLIMSLLLLTLVQFSHRMSSRREGGQGMTLTVDIQFHRPGLQLAVTHTFPLNGITSIMGPSGCGKDHTTANHCRPGDAR